MLLHCCLLLVLAPPAGQNYPRSELLLEASELAKPEVAKKFRILDVRPLKQYRAGSAFHASSVNLQEWSKAFAKGPDQAWWEKELGALGLDLNRPVVVYGDDMREVARAWWILKYWGLRDVRILHGGWAAYQAAGGKTQKAGENTEPFYQPTRPRLEPQDRRHTVKDEILQGLKDGKLATLDVRSKAEFSGDKKLANRGGHIPGCSYLEWSDVLDPKSQRFKAADELRKLFKEAGIDLDRPTATYCQSGGRASVMAFTLELMGAKDVQVYYRSWSEWGNDPDTPVAVPKAK
jgi:thiosulfate/3-mercaptopyruvate sulfurtransferase